MRSLHQRLLKLDPMRLVLPLGLASLAFTVPALAQQSLIPPSEATASKQAERDGRLPVEH
jgi:hypothetical protein